MVYCEKRLNSSIKAPTKKEDKKMLAFRVNYATARKGDTAIVLVEDISQVKQALAEKDEDFVIGRYGSAIHTQEEIPFSNVMVKDLSVTELTKILK